MAVRTRGLSILWHLLQVMPTLARSCLADVKYCFCISTPTVIVRETFQICFRICTSTAIFGRTWHIFPSTAHSYQVLPTNAFKFSQLLRFLTNPGIFSWVLPTPTRTCLGHAKYCFWISTLIATVRLFRSHGFCKIWMVYHFFQNSTFFSVVPTPVKFCFRMCTPNAIFDRTSHIFISTANSC